MPLNAALNLHGTNNADTSHAFSLNIVLNFLCRIKADTTCAFKCSAAWCSPQVYQAAAANAAMESGRENLS